MPNESQNNLTIAETEIGNSGVGHSTPRKEKRDGVATPLELSLALEESNKTIAILQKQLEEAKARPAAPAPTQDSDIDRLTKALETLVKQNAPQAPVNMDNINSSKDFMGTKTTVDGRSLAEAQETLMHYRNEEKLPISIPKSLQATFGPALPITVNGVRISIPCDGKTHLINRTHWEHAKERIAKVDLMNADFEPQIVEIN